MGGGRWDRAMRTRAGSPGWKGGRSGWKARVSVESDEERVQGLWRPTPREAL